MIVQIYNKFFEMNKHSADSGSNSFYTLFNTLQRTATEYKINNEIQLPQLVTLGEQSSGKSSLLNAIAGVNFLPQGQDIVTRCPIIIQMTTIAENEPEFMLVGGKICSSFEDVEKELRTYIKAHIDPNDISDVPIKVSINSHNVPTLSLVDLPGLIRNKLASQKAGIVEKIENLIYTYIANPKTVILAISPANNDIANSIALEKAREVDPKGVRTLGILTKMDLMTNLKNMDFFSGKLLDPVLKFGYFGVKCGNNNISYNDLLDLENSLDALDVSLEKGFDCDREEEFFSTDPRFKAYKRNFGIRYLRKKLEVVFADHLKKSFPDILDTLENGIDDIKENIKILGQEIIEEDQRKNFILKHTSEYCDQFTKSLNKKSNTCFQGDSERVELVGGAKIKEIFLNTYAPAIHNFDILKVVDDKTLRAQMRSIGSYEPTFLFDEGDLKNILQSQIKNLLSPSLKCLKLVESELLKIMRSVLVTEIEPFNTLKATLEDSLKKLIYDQSKMAEMIIKNHIEAHTYDIDTQQKDFLNAVNNCSAYTLDIEYKLNIHLKDDSEANAPKKGDAKDLVKLPKPHDYFETDSKMGQDEELCLKKTKLYLRSYMEVVKANLIHNIPTYIRYFLIKIVEKTIKEHLIAAVFTRNSEELLEIDNTKQAERNSLIKKLKSLEECMEIVQKIEASLDKTSFNQPRARHNESYEDE